MISSKGILFDEGAMMRKKEREIRDHAQGIRLAGRAVRMTRNAILIFACGHG